MVTTETHVYASHDGEQLVMELVRPALSRAAPSPAVLLFHGGGWREGHRSELLPHCRYLAGLGAIGITASYRLSDPVRGTTPVHCVDDALTAALWLRDNADRLGILPDRIVLGGGSAGAQMAAAAATEGAPATALVLFAPAVTDRGSLRFGFMGDASPKYELSSTIPPTIILHGTADAVVPIDAVRRFHRDLAAFVMPCELIEFSDAHHTFYSSPVSGHRDRVLAEVERFLSDIGLLC